MTAPQLAASELLASLGRRDARALRRAPTKLDFRLRCTFLFQWLGFAVLLAGSVSILLVLGPGFAVDHPLLFPLVIVIAVGRHVWDLFGLLGVEAHPYRDAPEELRGALDPDEIDALYHAVEQRLGSRGAPNLYIAVDNEANAFSVNSMFLGFIPRYRAIFLNSYLCRALSRDELRAVLVHELAHFHRYSGPLGRNAWLGVVGSVAACVFCFSLFPFLAETFLLALVVIWAPIPFLILYNLIASTGQRTLEHACDAIGAEIVGAAPMANALLKLGDRAEIYELVEQEIGRHLDENPKADAQKLAQAALDRVPEEAVTVDEMRSLLRSEPLTDETGGDSSVRKELIKSIRRNRRLRKALHVVPWSRFDSIRRDGWLDHDELNGYIGALVAREHAATHGVAADHPDEEPMQTHPSTRKRLVYLYLHFLAREGGGR
jgi:Zn-dependent protease with chaperone function